MTEIPDDESFAPIAFRHTFLHRMAQLPPAPPPHTTAKMLERWCAHTGAKVALERRDGYIKAEIDTGGIVCSARGNDHNEASTRLVAAMLTEFESVASRHRDKDVRATARDWAGRVITAIARGRLELGMTEYE